MSVLPSVSQLGRSPTRIERESLPVLKYYKLFVSGTRHSLSHGPSLVQS